MGSATSQSSRRCSSKAAREFPETFRETRNAPAIFAFEDRELRWRASTRSTARICATDAGNKNKAVAADGLFRQNGRRILASQPPGKNRAETKYRRLPRRE